MKRILLLALAAVALLAGQASADLYQLDAATADDMRLLSYTDNTQLWYVGQGLSGDVLTPPTDIYGSVTMIYQVGFTGFSSTSDGIADATIGLPFTIDLSTYDEGFLLPIANDNHDVWQYRAYVTDGSNTAYSNGGSWTTIDAGTAQGLLVPYDFTAFTATSSLGFEIRWNSSLNNNETGDQFATSVVPVPAAVILGVLGLGVVGWKLRRFA
jgi:hypothetical protein